MPFWMNCQVTKAGPSDEDKVYIGLKLENQFDAWFTADYSQRKEMLAVALAALSTGFKVEAFIEGPEGTAPQPYSRIGRLYIHRGS